MGYRPLTEKGVNAFADAASVEAELRTIARSQCDEEVRLRVARALRPRTVRLSGADVAAVREAHKVEVAAVQGLIPADAELSKIIDDRRAAVDEILAAGSELTLFAGKPILREFYKRHVAPLNVAYKEFCYQVAQIVSKRGEVAKVLDPAFDRLK